MMNKDLISLESGTLASSLDSYIYRVNQIQMLSQEEEHRLSLALYENNDLEAARRLVMSHLKFVVKVARGYMGYGLGLADLIQEGNIGLMKAVKRFDPHQGVRLVTFAVHWIKSEIHEFVIKNWRIVKIATTKAQRKLFFNLRRAKKRLGWFTQEEIQDVANELGVAPREVVEMERRLNASDMAFEGDPTEDEPDSSLVPAGYLVAPDSDPSQLIESENTSTQRLEALSKALETLDPRLKSILEARWFAEKKATFHELAAEHGVSAERIRQLENQAIEQLKSQIA